MKKMLRCETCEARGRTEVMEVPSDSPIGALYSDRGSMVGEIVSQMEASDLPVDTMAKTLLALRERRMDVVAPRKAFTAEGNGGLSFTFGSGKSYRPTSVALQQLAEKTRYREGFSGRTRSGIRTSPLRS